MDEVKLSRRRKLRSATSVAREVASFGIGITIIEPGGAHIEFRCGGARVAKHMAIYDQTPAHSFLRMLDKHGLAPGDPDRMAARIIESVDVEPAPFRLVLGSEELAGTLTTSRKGIVRFEAQTELAASTDFPPEARRHGTFLPNTTTCRSE
jgi:hypothetical protein